MEPAIPCPLCGGRLAVLAGPSRIGFFCQRSRGQFVNHGEFVADPSLPCREALRAPLENLLRVWEKEAASLAAVGAGALRGGRKDVGDTFGREAEERATRTLLLRSFLAARGPGPAGGRRATVKDSGNAPRRFALETSEVRPGVGLVRVEGAVDYSNVSVVAAALEAFFGRRLYRIVLDLSQTTHLASCAISLLLSAFDRAALNSGRLVFAHVSPPVRQVLDLLGFDEILPLADDVPSALTLV